MKENGYLSSTNLVVKPLVKLPQNKKAHNPLLSS